MKLVMSIHVCMMTAMKLTNPDILVLYIWYTDYKSILNFIVADNAFVKLDA